MSTQKPAPTKKKQEPKEEVQQMDTRCPRMLDKYPDSACPLAVLRLKAIRNAGKELTEEEESVLPGCPWAVNHQMSNYCFFKFMGDYCNDKPMSEMEVAAINNISVDTVKKTEKSAIAKLKQVDEFTEMKYYHDDEPVVTGKDQD